MTAKQFFDWQTDDGTDDVMRLADCLDGWRGVPTVQRLVDALSALGHVG
jgi:hypothetical protein